MRICFAFFIIVLISCSEDLDEMDQWEKEMASKYQSSYVELYHKTSTTTTNGRLTSSENYLGLDIHDSKVLSDIEHNERLLTEKYNEIHDIVFQNLVLNELPPFTEFRLNVITTNGFWIFKTTNIKTKTYRD